MALGILQRLLLERIAEEKRRREVYGRKLRVTIAEAFEVMPDRPQFCVRRLQVTEHVARAVGVLVMNDAFHADVTREARALGFVPIKNGGRALFRYARRRDHDEVAALAASRENRHDPRKGRRRRRRRGSPAAGRSPAFDALGTR
jgi:hypothetical protein